MPSAAKIIKMRAEPSRCPEPAEGLLELCRVQPKLWKFYCIIPIVLQKKSLSMKNAENLDAKELLEVPLKKMIGNGFNFSRKPQIDLV